MKKIGFYEEALELVLQNYRGEHPIYEDFCSVYMASTSNVKGTLGLYSDYKNVLSIGSTGSHGFEALLNGAESVDLFDVNKLQRMYYELLKTSIMYLEYEEFIKHFTLEKQYNYMPISDMQNLLSNEFYEKIYKYLSSEAEATFSPLYNEFNSLDIITSKLFRLDFALEHSYLKKYVSLYNKAEFYKLKKILLTNKNIINYKSCGLIDIGKNFDKKYDLILLDNVLQYYKDYKCFNSVSKVNKFIECDLNNLAKDDGKIQVAYGYYITANCIKYDEEFMSFNELYEYNEGILLSLLNNYKRYSYEIINGVESTKYGETSNVVLSKNKKNSRKKH